jgi:hypothetical protein
MFSLGRSILSIAQLHRDFIPNVYFLLLVSFLIPFSLIMTWQIIQLILLESNYFKFYKKKLVI